MSANDLGGGEVRFNGNFLIELHAAVQDAQRQTFEGPIKRDAFQNSPVDTGFNRSTIETETTALDEHTIQSTLYTESGYGGYLETGTSRMGPRPYIFTAFERYKDVLIANIMAAIGRIRFGNR